MYLSKALDKNISLFKNILTDDDMVVFRAFEIKKVKNIKCCLVYIDGMVNNEIINENVILPVMNGEYKEIFTRSIILDYLKDSIINVNEITKASDCDQMVGSILYGDAVLLIDGEDKGLILNTKGWQTRSITEPLSENVVRGPREGFVESLIINLSLIRRKIQSPNLKFKLKSIGKRTNTRVCICYIEGIANKKIVEEVIKRLDNISIDGILETGYIEDLIKDSPLSPFDTIGSSEKPDIVAGKLLEGRVAIFCDGTPFVLTMPFVFIEYFQASEDYYKNFFQSSINRIMRIIGFFLATGVPAIYVALVNFHQEIIPTDLLVSIQSAREAVPFPTVLEAFVMLDIFEIIREAGIRLPATIGQTISIVGALVLGQAAVEAKFVSAPIIIVVAITGICEYLLPKMLEKLIILRFIFLLFASIFGIYGYIFCLIGLSIYLMSMRSFGIPYMLNIGSTRLQDIKDTAIRVPWWYMKLRPNLIGQKNMVRGMNKGLKKER